MSPDATCLENPLAWFSQCLHSWLTIQCGSGTTRSQDYRCGTSIQRIRWVGLERYRVSWEQKARYSSSRFGSSLHPPQSAQSPGKRGHGDGKGVSEAVSNEDVRQKVIAYPIIVVVQNDLDGLISVQHKRVGVASVDEGVAGMLAR